MKPRLRLVLALLLPAAGQAAGDLVVVVNPRSGVEKLSREDVTNIFLGRYRQFPAGDQAVTRGIEPALRVFLAERS